MRELKEVGRKRLEGVKKNYEVVNDYLGKKEKKVPSKDMKK